jgi:hypothetical protein
MYRDGAHEVDEHDRAVGAILIGESLLAQCEHAAKRFREPHALDRWTTLRDAQDAYPEIWRQLDRAQQVLAARGANTAGYENLRPHVRASLVPGDDDSDQNVDPEALDDVRRAIAALKLAVPGADWGAIDKRTSVLVDDPALKKRRLRSIFVVLAILTALGAIWVIAAMPEKKVSERELMRRELAEVRRERQVEINALAHAAEMTCFAPSAQEYVKLLVFDGRRKDAAAFADDYIARCGKDKIIEKWAEFARPREPLSKR